MSTGVDARPGLGISGGIGHSGDVCGAVLGAAVGVGQLVGDHVTELEPAKARARQIVSAYYADFKKEFGHVDCPALTGYDLTTEEGFQAFKASDCKDRLCSKFVTYAVRRLLPVYEEVHG